MTKRTAAESEGRSPGAERQRRYRRLQGRGEIVLRIPVDLSAVVEALVASGALPASDPFTRATIARLIAAQLDGWAKSWRK